MIVIRFYLLTHRVFVHARFDLLSLVSKLYWIRSRQLFSSEFWKSSIWFMYNEIVVYFWGIFLLILEPFIVWIGQLTMVCNLLVVSIIFLSTPDKNYDYAPTCLSVTLMLLPTVLSSNGILCSNDILCGLVVGLLMKLHGGVMGLMVE